jgi:hypothetical protein
MRPRNCSLSDAKVTPEYTGIIAHWRAAGITLVNMQALQHFWQAWSVAFGGLLFAIPPLVEAF